MMAVAGLGLLLNASIMLSLRSASRNDLNVRSAFIHMLGDALGSIAIVAGAIAMRYTGQQQIDPILSIVIGLLIVWSAWASSASRLIFFSKDCHAASHSRTSPARCAASTVCSTCTISTSGASVRARTP